jgi:fido (protein-threonine AMPylation protein)
MSQKELLESLRAGTIDVEDVIEAVMKVGTAERRIAAAKILGVDPNRIIQEMFMGYKQRKQRKQLYGVDENIPNDLIGLYYELGDRMPFDSLKKAFVSKYITQESRLEEVHSAEEIEGLRAMYEYIHSDESDYMFNIYTLKELHEKLYSKAPYPEFGGTFRRDDVYLPGTGTEIAEWSMIRPMLNELDKDVLMLWDLAPEVRICEDAGVMIDYLDEVIELGCKIIKVHPFKDGNGRSVRGFMNKLLEAAGLPPVYIKVNERTEYHKAMNKANNEGDYTDIKNFYHYKVCDSIVELDINPRVRRQIVGGEDTTGSGKVDAFVKSKADDKK